MQFKNINNFWQIKTGVTIKEVISYIELQNENELNLEDIVNSVLPIEEAENGDLTFFTKPIIGADKYIECIKASEASYCLIQKSHLEYLPSKIRPIIVENAYISFIKTCNNIIKPIKSDVNENKIGKNCIIHPSANIGQGVHIGDNVFIDSCVKIGNGVYIGDNVQVFHGSSIGYNVSIDSNTIINENVSIKFAKIGKNCIIHPSANIGQDGFGFTMDNQKMVHFKINHYGAVEIEDNVEIGSVVCIDRGVFGDTFIGNGTKIGNHTQIAHNVSIGRHNVIVGKCAIGGSAKIGSYCMIGGNVAIIGHISIGNQCYIYGGSNVANSFPDKSKIFAAWPAESYSSWVKKLGIFNIFCKKMQESKLHSGKKKAFSFAKLLNLVK